MYIKSFLTTLAVLAGTANAAAGVQLESRAPKDKSGNSQMIYTCDEVILPNPGGAGGAGEGGSGSFSDSFKFIDRDGATIEATACETINGYCTNCLFNSKYLSSPTNVTGCYNPPAGMYQGCSLKFQYNNYPYNTQEGQPYCGHEVSYPGFEDIGKSICYFNDGYEG